MRDAATSGRYERRDRLAVMRCGRRVDEVRQDGTALEHAGLACRADPIDPAAAGLRLGAQLDLADDHAVAERAFGGVVGRVDAGDFAERPERGVLVQQSGGEAAGLLVASADALLKQRLEVLAQRTQLAL